MVSDEQAGQPEEQPLDAVVRQARVVRPHGLPSLAAMPPEEFQRFLLQTELNRLMEIDRVARGIPDLTGDIPPGDNGFLYAPYHDMVHHFDQLFADGSSWADATLSDDDPGPADPLYGRFAW